MCDSIWFITIEFAYMKYVYDTILIIYRFYEDILEKAWSMISRKMSRSNECFCMVVIPSVFLYSVHSSLHFIQSVGYGFLRDVTNIEDIHMWFPSSSKDILKSKEVLCLVYCKVVYKGRVPMAFLWCWV